MDDIKKQLREEYKRLYGRNAPGIYTEDKLRKCLAEFKVDDSLPTPSSFADRDLPTPGDDGTEEEVVEDLKVSSFNTQKYKELPPPIVEHLKQAFGAWLNYFEVGQEYKQDFGGYGMYIKVPKEFSSEHRVEDWPVFDNRTRAQKIDPNTGAPVVNRVVVEDIRWKSLRDLADAIKWVNTVKEHIIKTCYNKGIRLPNTNAPLEETKATYDQYKQSIHK